MKIRPYGDQILVRRHERNRLAGDIYVPDVAQDETFSGVVVAVGPGVPVMRKGKHLIEGGRLERVDHQIRPGDMIQWIEGTSMDLSIQGERYVLIKARHVLLVWEREQQTGPTEKRRASARMGETMRETPAPGA